MESVDAFVVRSLWGNMSFEYVFSLTVGNSGGVLCVWDRASFTKINVSISDYFVLVEGVWNASNSKLLMIGVYAPQENLESIDKQIDQHGGLEDLLTSRRDLWKKLTDIDVNNGKDLAQKAKWVVDADAVKQVFSQHFASLFSLDDRAQIHYNNEVVFPTTLSFDQNLLLEEEVTNLEIKKAVWDCGSNKSPGPDGSFPKGCNPSFITLIPKLNDAKVVKDYRPISLIGCQYKIVGKILANRLSMVMDKLISKEQSAFIKDCQILDGPMILSEVIQWCNRKRKKSMIFKVDFEKAFDSVRWDFLDMILKKFGFGSKWRVWIKGCLISSTASVLVNGSPTKEFQFQKGLRQGDPLSPFLFLLVMESLHFSFTRAMNFGFFKGIKIGGQESVNICHLFYADDAVFIGEWKEENFRNLVYILHCFYLASGLRINVHKCSLMGVGGVNFDKVCIRASVIGCEAAKPPFKYLGVLVGNNMSRIHNWDVVINKVLSRLSKWKAKTLSIGGRYTLTKSVLSVLPTYYFSLFKVPIGVLNRLETICSKFFRGVDADSRKLSWFSWDKVIASKEVGGLGMYSFYAMNCSLLFKWIWRFKTNPGALWALIIKAIHGNCNNLSSNIQVGNSSPWLDCIQSMKQLHSKGIDLLSCISKKVGNGNKTSFWLEKWIECGVLKEKFPRLFALEINKQATVFDKLQVELTIGMSLSEALLSVSSAYGFLFDDGLCIIGRAAKLEASKL
ncbi:RNA-directed DNA polymerase, eukaryota [Tanacetum coccineum]